jgi:hypothetical protein
MWKGPRTLDGVEPFGVARKIDEGGKAEHVREKNELVSMGVRDLARRREELDTLAPLVMRELCLPGEVVEVRDQPLD